MVLAVVAISLIGICLSRSKSEIRKEEERTTDQAPSTETAEAIGQLLAQVNSRDADGHLEGVDGTKRVLQGDIEDWWTRGSVVPFASTLLWTV